MNREPNREEFLTACRARSGLLALGEPRTWRDSDGTERKTVTISKRLKFRKIPLHDRLRDFVLGRDLRRCVICEFALPAGQDSVWFGSTLRYLEIDHIISRRNGGSHHPDNLQALCNRCNARKSVLIDRRALRA